MAEVATRVVRRPPAAAVGVGVWLASEVMFFAGLFAAYFALRSANDVWPPHDVELDTVRAALSTVVLLVSSATVHRAEVADHAGDDRGARRWTAVTAALGLAFVVNLGLEWHTATFDVSSNAYGTIYYALTGFHGLHVAIGVIMLAVMALAPPGWAPSTPNLRRGIGWYWHFVDVVWVAMFTTIFVVR